MVVIIGDDDIARVADDVNYFLVPAVEVFVTLDDSRARNPGELLSGVFDIVRDYAFDIGESDRLMLMNQIGDKEASPGISRLWVGHQEGIVRKNFEIPPAAARAKQPLQSPNEFLENQEVPSARERGPASFYRIQNVRSSLLGARI